jgi:hypothetical protein
MGVNWIMEVISWAAGGPKYLWYITDLGNTLQGVLIFFIFVWKQKVRRLLVRRFRSRLVTSPGSQFESSTKSRMTPSYTSCNYTNMTSVSSHEQFSMKPIGTVCNSDVPWSAYQLRHNALISLALSGTPQTQAGRMLQGEMSIICTSEIKGVDTMTNVSENRFCINIY